MDNALYAELDSREARISFLGDSMTEARDALRTIIAARDLDPDAPISTPLLAAIEHARRIVA